MKKELNGGVVVGILVVVAVVVVVMAWRVLGPPPPAGLKSFDKESLKVMQEKHAQSAADIAAQQQRAFQQAQGGGR